MIIALYISIALNLIALGLIYWLRKEQKTNFSLHEGDLEAARHAYEALMSDLSNYQVEIHKKIVDGNDLKTMFTPPPEYFQVAYNLVAESTDNILFYTEKTFKNYWFRKPFIICGAQNINHTLKYYGFELYDEIFDYSFDFKTNIDDRIEGIIKNVINLKEINNHYLWKVLQKKLDHNYNNMMEIFYSKKYVPPILKYHLKNGVQEIKSKI